MPIKVYEASLINANQNVENDQQMNYVNNAYSDCEILCDIEDDSKLRVWQTDMRVLSTLENVNPN